MADETLISWADMTFNPWVGCTRVSPACDGCYAAHLMETRMGRVQWGGPGIGAGTRDRTSAANWRKPIAWNKKAAAEGRRPFLFCSSLTQRTIRIPKPADPFQKEIEARLLQIKRLREREPRRPTMDEIRQQLRDLAKAAERLVA